MMLSPADHQALRGIFQDGWLSDPGECLVYGYDNSKQAGPVMGVARPQDEQQIARLLQLCSREGWPVICRGAGSNTVGATVPVTPSIVLSLERMQTIVAYVPQDRRIRVQAGLSNGAVQRLAGQDQLFWPPDPTSADYASIGGNLGCNAGGPRAVKYGTCRENTLGLRAVLANGEIVQTGCQTTKGVVGYDLTRLLIGSEGTLGVITDATLLLRPRPPDIWTVRATYDGVASASRAVAAIMGQPVTPCALEFMDGTACRLVRAQGADLPAAAGALLMIEVDGDAARLADDLEQIRAVADGDGCLDWKLAQDPAAARDLWQARKALSPCLRSLAPKKINEDIVVPVSRLPELITGLDALAREHGLQIVNFGHAGNGNVHVNILADPADPAQAAAIAPCLDAVFSLALALEGTLSGEHGVGLAKQGFIGRELGTPTLAAMQAIKDALDPAGILNPGKVFPTDPPA